MRPVLALRGLVHLEQLPLILAVIVGLLGVALLADAFLDDVSRAPRLERRRRLRAGRHRWGEALVGFGVLAGAAGLAGGDSWPYGTTAMIVGVVLLTAGAALNFRLMRELVVNHGVARRQPERATPGPDASHGRVEGDSLAVTPPAVAPPAHAPSANALPTDDRSADAGHTGQSERPMRIR